MELRVLIPGLYNGDRGKARWFESGDFFETSSVYGLSLVGDHFCEVVTRQEEETVSSLGTETSFEDFLVLEWELPRRAVTSLVSAGFQTTSRLAETEDEELLALPGVGVGSLEKIRKGVRDELRDSPSSEGIPEAQGD